MSLIQILCTPRLVRDELDLYSLSVTAEALDLDVRRREAIRVGRDPLLAAIVVDAPEDGGFQVRVRGFTVDGVAHSVAVKSRFEGEPAVTWAGEGADAVSPRFTATGRYVVRVTATPTAGGPPRQAAVPIRFDKPGKPVGDLLERFPEDA